MEAIKNLKMVEAARTEAKSLVETDPTLSRYPALKKRTQTREDMLHFE
jgi:hypothetical protein